MGQVYKLFHNIWQNSYWGIENCNNSVSKMVYVSVSSPIVISNCYLLYVQREWGLDGIVALGEAFSLPTPLCGQPPLSGLYSAMCERKSWLDHFLNDWTHEYKMSMATASLAACKWKLCDQKSLLTSAWLRIHDIKKKMVVRSDCPSRLMLDTHCGCQWGTAQPKFFFAPWWDIWHPHQGFAPSHIMYYQCPFA